MNDSLCTEQEQGIGLWSALNELARAKEENMHCRKTKLDFSLRIAVTRSI